MKVQVVDPSAYTPPYDHALCAALAATGVDVELITSRFAYGPVATPEGYERRELFYRHAHRGASKGPRSRATLALKLAEHVPGMLRCKREARAADVVHFQWLTVQQIDGMLLPKSRPLVLTAHDVMPREPRRGQLSAQRRLYDHFDAIVVHSHDGRRRLVEELGVDEGKVSVIPHGIFKHLAARTPGSGPGSGPARESGSVPARTPGSGPVRTPGPGPVRTPASVPARPDGPVVLFFGLLRPYKGIDLLVDAWRSLSEQERRGGELWIAGMSRMDLSGLGLEDAEDIRLTPRFIDDEELPFWFEQADLVVLPYRQADQSGVLFTALAFGKPLLLSDVGGFPEIASLGAAATVPAGDASALAGELKRLLGDEGTRRRMGERARALGEHGGELSWASAAKAHLELYERLLRG